VKELLADVEIPIILSPRVERPTLFLWNIVILIEREREAREDYSSCVTSARGLSISSSWILFSRQIFTNRIIEIAELQK